MAFEIPTLEELVNRTRQAFRNELPGTDAFLWPNNVNVSAKVIGGMTHMDLLWLAYIAKQRFISTADGEFLDRHGVVYGIARLAASYAKGKVSFTGTAGITIPAGAEMQRADGLRYRTSTSALIDGLGNVILSVIALEPGSAGNAVAGTAVSLTAARTGVSLAGVVHADGIGLGADEEGDESYRARLLHHLRLPPHGGAAHDYVAWARQIPGVSRVFVDPLAQGPGTVSVYFLMDDIYANGIPQGADVAAVQAYIDAVRPVTASVSVAAPLAEPVDIEISGLSPDTTAVRDAVLLELADLFRREVRVSTVTDSFTLFRSKIWQAISQASGEEHHDLVMPDEDVVYAAGRLPVLGDVTFS